MPEYNLAGKRVIVTGAARGLGRPVAIAYVKAGAQVLFTATDKQMLNEAREDSGGSPDQAIALAADLTDQTSIQRIVATARETFGGVDVLFNNAGLSTTAIRPDFFRNPLKFWEVDDEDYRRFFEVNTLSALELSCLVAPEMMARGWGRIVCNTTSLDTMLRPGNTPYGGSKAALEAMTACMAGDLEGTGVTANILVPGGPANTRMIPEDMGLPKDQLISADCLVGPALWLASDFSDGVPACRFRGVAWDSNASLEEALAESKAPIAWTGFGAQAIIPD